MEQLRSVKEVLSHVLSAAVIFFGIAVIAVGIDLISSWLDVLGVSKFTKFVLESTSHILLACDLVILLSNVLSGIQKHLKEVFK